jgi:hypothetical protein
VRAARDVVLALLAVVADDDDARLPFAISPKLDDAVDLGHDGRLARLARLEQLDDARQTARDVAAPPMWNVRIVSCVPGSPIDCAAMTPTASPMLTGVPRARSRP